MSTMETRGGRLPDEARFELAAAAGAAERRNRPAWLVWGGVLLLGVVLLLAVIGLTSRAAAMRELRRAQEDQVAVEQLVAQHRALSDAERQNPNRDVGVPRDDLLSTLENLAVRAGFKTAPRSSTPRDDRRQGLNLKTISYFQVKEPSVKAILEWLRLATQEPSARIAGLEVESLSLRPVDDRKAWQMNLTLRRWERAP
jgi:hypothetical protein